VIVCSRLFHRIYCCVLTVRSIWIYLSFYISHVVTSLDIKCIVVSCAVPMGNVSWMLFQEGRSANIGLRRWVRQAEHTRNNPHVKCTGVSNRHKQWIMLILGPFINISTDSPAAFIAAGHRSRYTQTATGAQGSYCYISQPTHCSRDKHSEWLHIN